MRTTAITMEIVWRECVNVIQDGRVALAQWTPAPGIVISTVNVWRGRAAVPLDGLEQAALKPHAPKMSMELLAVAVALVKRAYVPAHLQVGAG